ncbi:MAG: hypothetical protein ACQEUM_07085 [Pseudomonadota bacterium]
MNIPQQLAVAMAAYFDPVLAAYLAPWALLIGGLMVAGAVAAIVERRPA